MEPRKPDPWEARERERAKRQAWQQGRKSSSASANNSDDGFLDWEGGFDWAGNALPLGLLAALVLLLAASVPFDGLPNALLYRSFLTKAGSIVLLFLAIIGGANAPQSAGADIRRGPHPLLLLLLLWSTVCLVLAPFRGYAVLEFVRILDGIAAYFVAGYALQRGGKQAAVLLVGLLGFGCLVSLAQIAEIGQQTGGFAANITMSRLGAHGNVGSALLLFWPPALALALWPDIEDKRRIAAIAAALIIGCALLVERARSSWIGAIAAVLVLGACYLLTRNADTAPRRAKQNSSPFARAAGSPFVLLAIGLVIFLVLGGGTMRLLANRAATISSGAAVRGETFQSRLVTWSGAARMTREKPWTGWGLGTYPVLQGRWTHVGDEAQAALGGGADNLSLAHNYYLQWAAETGYTGLFLYVAFVAAYVVTLLRGLRGASSPFQKAVISGVAALVVGSHLDALASPSHHFHGVWALLWVWMGLGIAALRVLPARSAAAAAEAEGEMLPAPLANADKPVPVTAWIAGAVLGGLAVVSVAGFAARIHTEGSRVARGVFEVSAEGAGAGKAGATLAWTARFRNEKGVFEPTSPGTEWSLQNAPTDPLAQKAQLSLYVPPSFDARDYSGGLRRSQFRVLIPAEAVQAALKNDPKTAPQITVKATYQDAYGRTYEAWSTRTLSVQ